MALMQPLEKDEEKDEVGSQYSLKYTSVFLDMHKIKFLFDLLFKKCLNISDQVEDMEEE